MITNIMILTRNYKQSNELYGTLKVGVKCFFTLENFNKKIPSSIYPVSLYKSPKYKRYIPLLQMTEPREWIEIHGLNYASDSEGCIGAGLRVMLDQHKIQNCKPAIDYIVEQIDKKIITQILIIDNWE